MGNFKDRLNLWIRFMMTGIGAFWLLYLGVVRFPPASFANWANIQLIKGLPTWQLPIAAENIISFAGNVVSDGKRIGGIWGPTEELCLSLSRYVLLEKPDIVSIPLENGFNCVVPKTAYIFAGYAYANAALMDQAVASWRKAHIEESFLVLARFENNSGMAADAIRLLELTVQINPECSECYAQLGEILLAQQQYENAGDVFDNGLKRQGVDQPFLSQLEIGMGIALFEQGKLDEARPFLELGLQANPNEERGNYYLGRIYQNAGLMVKAEQAYRRAISLTSTDIRPHLWLALALTAMKHCPEALNEFQTVLANTHDVSYLASSFYGEGQCYEYLNQVEFAISAYQQVISVNPNHVDARIALADLYVKMGNAMEARRFLLEILSIDPQNQSALRRLANLTKP